jgi:hypothetical protein
VHGASGIVDKPEALDDEGQLRDQKEERSPYSLSLNHNQIVNQGVARTIVVDPQVSA